MNGEEEKEFNLFNMTPKNLIYDSTLGSGIFHFVLDIFICIYFFWLVYKHTCTVYVLFFQVILELIRGPLL